MYQRFPAAYDAVSQLRWDVQELIDLCPVDDATIIDAGAGTGWLTEALARRARTVFAVEPVARLRAFIRDRARAVGLRNVHVLDGVLHAIPLPAHTADVLVTSRAIGWRLREELPEIERVLRPEGTALHFLGAATDAAAAALDRQLTSAEWGYTRGHYRDPEGPGRVYTKTAP